MLGFISKLFGGNKSEKDIKEINPLVTVINNHFNQYQSLSNDVLRAKTQEFKSRIKSKCFNNAFLINIFILTTYKT